MSTQGSTKDVISTLTEQHNQVKSLFATLTSAGPSEETFCELRRMLSVHETAEEEVVYPRLRAIGAKGQEVADARIQEEDQAKDVLSKLEKLDVSSAEFRTMIAEFETAVLKHATNEEQQVFPLLRENCTADDLQKMAKALEVAEAAAPTHPHPHGPNTATGNIIVGPAVAIMDRVRDAMHKARS